MQKSLFKKYLCITSSIILICLICIMFVMITVVSKQWSDDKRDLLGKNATLISKTCSINTTYDDESDIYVINNPIVRSFIKIFASTNDIDIFVTDMAGKRLIGEYTKSGTVSSSDVPHEIVSASINNTTSFQTTLGGIYDHKYYVVGTPIQKTDAEGTVQTLGIVFCATNSASLVGYWMDAMKMFIWVGIAVFLLSLCVVWLFTFRLVNPLRQMSAAAHSFGEGDFSKKIPVTSEDEIGQLAQALNNMALSLSDSESTRRNFIANVSHELKTPMTSISGFIDGILDGTIPPSEEKKYLNIVSQETKRLSRLVKTMLDLSRIDNGELKLRPGTFELSEIIFSTALTFEKSIEEKNIEMQGLETLKSVTLDGDSDMIHQVVYNLFENAVKFTDNGGYINCSMEIGTDRVTVKLRNSGMGIAPEELGMIFERFYKTDKSRSKDKNGMGLGLFIVKTIIRLHGGEIHVSSELNKYTEFDFWLPKKPEEEIIKEQLTPKIQDGEYKE